MARPRGHKQLITRPRDGETKVCKTCKEEKPILQFPLHSVQYGRPYYNSRCYDCYNVERSLDETPWYERKK